MKHAIFTGILVGALGHTALAQPAPAPDKHNDDLAKAADAAADLANVASPDLAKAADATADVANTPAAAPSNDAAAKAAADVDLASLGLDPASAATAVDDKLNIYGFADIKYDLAHWGNDPLYFPQDTRGFQVGNLNLYLAKNLTARARALAEIRFTFLPNGGTNEAGGTIDDTAGDATNYGRPVQWGGIVIERVYAEYDLTDWLTVRGGRWLTPYGIWNIDHGSPAIITTGKPYVIGEAFFPERQTGLELFGHHDFDGVRLSAHLTASNGRGALDSIQDRDNQLAFGGRLELEAQWGLRAGASYYRGRYTGLPSVTAMGAIPALSYREQAYGLDVQLDRGRFHAQAELLVRDRQFAREADADRVAAPLGLDNRDFGFYALAGYRFARLWNVMPFAYVEYYEPANTTNYDYAYDGDLGLNFRPVPSLVLKAMGQIVKFHDDAALFGGAWSIELTGQAAWMF